MPGSGFRIAVPGAGFSIAVCLDLLGRRWRRCPAWLIGRASGLIGRADSPSMDIYAAGGIVFDDQRRLLLIRRGRPPAALAWSVPGGRCLPGESAEAACVRELAEETGLVVRVDRLAGRIHRPAPGGHRFVIDDFVCTMTGGELRAGDDAVEAGWFDRASFDRLRLVPALAETLAGWSLLPD